MKILSFLQYCDEKRRNPELNPKISAYNYLKEYKDRDDIYITFTDIEKVGIKPLSTFNTPNGIYTYPLKEIWKEYNVDRARSLKVLPFASDRPWINILQAKHSKGFIKNLKSDYTSRDYDRDRNTLLNMLIKVNKDSPEAEMIDLPNQIENSAAREAKIKSPVGLFWNLTRNIANYHQFEFNLKSHSTTQAWNNLLRRLGYSGFGDKSGTGLIHISEPLQAVFLHSQEFKVLDRVENKDYLPHTNPAEMIQDLFGWTINHKNIVEYEEYSREINIWLKNVELSGKNINGSYVDNKLTSLGLNHINLILENSIIRDMDYYEIGSVRMILKNSTIKDSKNIMLDGEGGIDVWSPSKVTFFKCHVDTIDRDFRLHANSTIEFFNCIIDTDMMFRTGTINLHDCKLSLGVDIMGVNLFFKKFGNEVVNISKNNIGKVSWREVIKMAEKSKTFQDFERLYNEFRDKKSSDFEKMLFG